MDITFEKTNIEPTVKKMDFGKITVCSKCGNGRIPYVEEKYNACCEGATLISLKEYTENVLGKSFENDKWRFETTDIRAVRMDVTNDVRYLP